MFTRNSNNLATYLVLAAVMIFAVSVFMMADADESNAVTVISGGSSSTIEGVDTEANSYDFAVKDIQYKINEDGTTVSIAGFTGSDTIPATVENDGTTYEVTGFLPKASLTYEGTNYVVDEANTHFFTYSDSKDADYEPRGLYSYDKTVLYAYPCKTTCYSYTAPSTLKEVKSFAFAKTSASKSGDYCSYHFENSSLEKIGDNAFQYASTHYVILPSTVTDYGNYLFVGAFSKDGFGNSYTLTIVSYSENLSKQVTADKFSFKSDSPVEIDTYDPDFSITADNVKVQYMCTKVGEEFTYKGITYRLNGVDFGTMTESRSGDAVTIDNCHAVTAVSAEASTTYFTLNVFNIGITPAINGTDPYVGEVYVVTDVDSSIFDNVPAGTSTTVLLSSYVRGPADSSFAKMDDATFHIYDFISNNSFYLSSFSKNGYSTPSVYSSASATYYQYTYTALENNGTLIYAGKSTVAYDLFFRNDIKVYGDNAVVDDTAIQQIYFSTSLSSIGSKNFDNVTFKDVNGNVLSKTVDALKGKCFKAADDGSLTEVPTVNIEWNSLYGRVTFSASSFPYNSPGTYTVETGTEVSVSEDGLTLTVGSITATVSVSSSSYGEIKFTGWSMTSGTITGSTTITANFTGPSIVTVGCDVTKGALNNEYGSKYSAGYSLLVADGASYSISGSTLTVGYSTFVAVPNGDFAFKEWTIVTADSVAVKATSGKISNGGATFYAVFSGPCTVSFVSEYGTFDKTSVKVAEDSTFSVSGDKITFSDGQTVTVTPKTVEHMTITTPTWSQTSGTVSDGMILTVTFKVETAQYTVTVKSENLDYGNVDGQTSESFKVSYGSAYSVSGDVMTFTFNGETQKTVTAAPTKETAEYTYAVDSWSTTSGTVSGDMEITVSFTKSAHMYTVTMKSNDTKLGLIGTTSPISVEFAYGTTYTVKGSGIEFNNSGWLYSAIANASPEHHTYSFSAWDTTGGTVTGDITLTATFVDEVDKFVVTISSSNADYGKVNEVASEALTIPYGYTYKVDKTNLVFYDGDAQKDTVEAKVVKIDNVQYENVFKGWSSESGTVTGDMAITANFAQELRTYGVTFISNDASIGLINNESSADFGEYQYGTAITVGADNSVTIGDDKWTMDPRTSNYANIANRFVKFQDEVPDTVTGNIEINVIFESYATGVTFDGDKSANLVTNGHVLALSDDVVKNIKDGADNLTLTVNPVDAGLGAVSVTLDKTAISNLVAGTISVSICDNPDVVKNAYRTFEIDFGDNHNIGGTVTYTICIDLDESKNYAVGYVHDDQVDKVSASYNKATQELTYSTNHFSTYAVLDADSSSSNDNTMLYVAVVVVVIVAVLALAFLVKSGKISFGKKA